MYSTTRNHTMYRKKPRTANRRERSPRVELDNEIVKYIPQGAIGDQEEVAQLDGEQVLCCGPEAAAPFARQQRSERGHAAVHPQQEQLADPHVQSAGRDSRHLSRHAAPGSDAGNPTTPPWRLTR